MLGQRARSNEHGLLLNDTMPPGGRRGSRRRSTVHTTVARPGGAGGAGSAVRGSGLNPFLGVVGALAQTAGRAAVSPTSRRRSSHRGLEALENRQLLDGMPTVGVNGTLTLFADSNKAHSIGATLSADGKTIRAYDDNYVQSFPVSKVNLIKIFGSPGPDLIKIDPNITIPVIGDAGPGNDTVYLGNGNDTFRGGDGNDEIHGGNGNDVLWGDAGNDTIYGVAGTNSLYGLGGDDALFGGIGDDYIDGGAGTNTASGGGGNDVIINTQNDSQPTDNINYVPSPLQPVISSLSGLGVVAGQPIQVNAIQSGLGVGTPLTAKYQWDFGDPGSEYDNLTGYNAAHIYANPGVYKITLTITNQSGQVSTTTSTAVVANDTRRVIYVSPTGNDNNNGSTQATPVKTVHKANLLLRSSGTGAKILFQAGAEYDTAEPIFIAQGDVTVGSYGTGSRPVLMWNGPRNGGSLIESVWPAKNVVIQNLTLDTIFNQDTLQAGVPHGILPGGVNIAIVNCQFLNVGYAINGSVVPDGVLVQDNVAPNRTTVRGSAVWFSGSDWVVIGNNFNGSAQENLLRGTADRILIYDNTLRNGWTDTVGLNKGCLVLNSGSYAYVSDNTATTGAFGVGPISNTATAALNDKGAMFNWTVFDGNTLNTYLNIGVGAHHTMVRNNVINIANTEGINVAAYNATYNRIVSDLTVTNNTVVNTGSYGGFMKVYGKADSITLTKNLMVGTKLQYGINGTVAVYVNDTSLESFTKIDGNVWPVPMSINWRAYGGQFYMSTAVDDATAYLTPAAWNAQTVVGTDTVKAIALSTTEGATVNGVYVGSNLPFAQ
jgi:PKD repeat protein